VAYQLVSVPEDMIDSASDFTKREIVVSTTRPETIFGDTAVAVNPADERYQDMIGGLVKLPLTERVIPIIADEHAEMEYGTGAVKITPAHDFDDFEVGERHGLERIRVIGEDGKMTAAVGEKYAGLTTEECRKQVLEDLEAQGLLRGEKKITHAVAHCYKCGAVIEPMLKAQWFIDVKRLAKAAIEHLERGEIKFHPANKKKVLINYLEGLKDWNISRQIPWGIPIPAFRQTETQDAPEWIFDIRTNLQKIEVGGVHYYRDEDTFDTWFSSSHWPIVCTNWLAGKENPYYPLNVMETGADILFAWVARMIMMGIYVTGEVPFREVYLHGLVLDEHGQKMSKSKGNVINPMDLVTKYGSDAFRLGILRGRSAGMNQAFSENSVMAGRNLCNKLWNISRFIQGMVDESHSGSVVAAEMIQAEAEAEVVNEGAVQAGAELPYSTDNMGEDWICRELTACKDEIEDDMANYRFSEAVETLYSVIWDKYADWFIESQKIYKNVPLLKMTLEMILKMLHPFAPFVTEAIWQSLSWTEGLLIVQKWPTRLVFDAVSAQNFESLMVVVSETRRVSTELSGASKGKKWTLLYGDDSLVDDNQLLLTKLTGVASVISCEGQPQGLRLALVNHEVYLDVPAEIVAEYRDNLEQRILSVGRELDALNLRMMNPNYVDKAPAALVKQTRDGIAEKTALIERLKGELRVIE
jgi:valyl-tRNA synthetase